MSYEQLLESLEASAGEKITEYQEKAKKDAAEIRKEAEKKDEGIKKRHLEAVRKAVETEKTKSSAKIREENRMQLIRVKDTVYQKSFSEAQKILSSARENIHYEKNFSRMLKEAVTEMEGEEKILHIDRRDEVLCKQLIAELHLNCDLVTDLTIAGGLNISTRDGQFVVFNTIEARFEKAKVLLKPEIFAILYGGPGGI
jgi:V/A-type H+/Na+-transporting ATPase subunit E